MSGTSDYQDPTDPSIDPTQIGAEDPLNDALAQAGVGVDDTQPQEMPVYKAMPQSRIPVSSKRGPVWKARKDTSQKAMADLVDAWDECIRYYNHDQADHRDRAAGDMRTSGNRHIARRLNEMFSSTENIVFSNVNAQIPELYAKNPIVSCTATPSSDDNVNAQNDQFARCVEKLINVLFGMKAAPGVNIKPIAKRNILVALLTNRAWFEVGYVTKDKSREQAYADLLDLSNQLAQAKDADDIGEAEQALVALEEKIEFLQPSGPYVRMRLPHQVIMDPDSVDPHLRDCNWIMIEDMLPTDYINAIYGMEDEQSDEVTSIYEPTHILVGGSGSVGFNETDKDFTLFDTDQNNYNAYGFDNKNAFDKAKRTKVWYIWDKVTRRLEMYADNDWTWPIWVWDDPYQLQNFFPLTPLWFHDNPVALYAKGEVSFYLDQQDQINEINDERRRALFWARRNLFYDAESGMTQEIAEKILKGPDATATPIRVPEGKKPTELIFSIPPPSMAFHQLFDKQDLYASVDRIASTNEVERGGQFKTNTTNKAIDYYSTMGNMRMDMRLDAIEDALGDIGWKIAQLCLRFMDADVVRQLIGQDVTAFWKPMDNLSDFSQLSVACVGGSTQKLTSAGKKQEAVQVGQILAQYVRAAPATALKVTLKMMSNAFDDFMITKEDWAAIAQETAQMAAAQQGGAPGQQMGGNPAQPGASSVPGGGEQPSAPPPGMPPGGNPMQMAAMVTQALSQLPPPVLQAIGQALAQGVPPQAIMAQMLQASQGGGGPPNGAGPQPQPQPQPQGGAPAQPPANIVRH